jgi:hypothetical protein
LPKARASSSPVVDEIVISTREIHGKIVAGRKPSMQPDEFLP